MEPSIQKKPESNIGLNSEAPIFWNFSLDKGRLKSFVSWFLKNHGEKKTIELLEQLKNLGFGYATQAGISLGIEDLKIPPTKIKLLAEAETIISNSLISYRKGEITGLEKMQQFIETWHETSENLKQEVVRYFEKTDILNPVYMMAFSGARGNLSQVRQLVGMRGLMADPQGKIIDFPIQSNFREGLTLTEYLISTYGARKGIVDTALRTATAGYLTRRLVDVAQHVIVSKFDCKTQRGIFLFDMKEGNKTIYSFPNRLTGRVLAQDVYFPRFGENLQNNETLLKKLAFRNQEVNAELALAISKITKKALVRSPLTCETRKLVCQLCYGWSLATSRLVSIGEAVGVIAGQSIGEPGTQLTMRTFHTGGVFSGGITEQINAPFEGLVEYDAPISGTCIRTPQGYLAFLTKTNGTLFFKKCIPDVLVKQTLNSPDPEKNPSGVMNVYKIPPFTILFARHSEKVEKNRLLAQISSLPTGQKTTQTIEQTIYSALEGEVYYSQIDLLEDIDEKYGERISKAEDWSKVWVLSAKISNDTLTSNYLPICGDFVSKNSIVNQIQWMTNFTQNSYINSNLSPHPKSRHLDYAFELKTPFTIQSNILSLVKFKENSKLLTKSFRMNQPHHLKTDSGSYNITSKYNIHDKFSDNVLNFVNLRKTQKDFSTTIFKKIATQFTYPYQGTFRFYFVKMLSQTFISLPILRSGMLTVWLNSRTKQAQTKKKEKSITLLQKDRTVLIRKLNMNKKFRLYNGNKTNFFHPLILSNFVPFSILVKEKTIKNFFKRKAYLADFNIENSMVYPYNFQISKITAPENINQKLKNQTVSEINASFSKKTLNTMSRTFLDLKERKLNTRQSLKEQNSYSSLKNKKIKKNGLTRSSSKKSKNLKLESLSIKTPLISLKPTNIRYQKLGYFISILNQENQTDQFFSFLPLQGDSMLNGQQRNLVENSSGIAHLHSSLEKQNLFQANKINILNLKNTDILEPSSKQGFYWFPQFSQTLTNGLFLFSSPSLYQNFFRKNFLTSKTKNLKNTLRFSKNFLSFLNLAQSLSNKKQIIKKRTKIKKSKESVFKFLKNQNNHYYNYFPFILTRHIMEMIVIPKSLAILFKQNTSNFYLNRVIRKSKEKKFNALRVELKHVKLNSSFWSSSNYNKYLENSFLKEKLSLLKSNYSLTRLIYQKPKYLLIKKSFFICNKKPLEKDLAKINEPKISNFSTKDFQNLKHLIIKTNFSKKSSVSFHDIFWLPQENYSFSVFLHSSQLQTLKLNSPSYFTSQNRKKVSLNNKEMCFYLTNNQGLKERFYFKHEGLLNMQKVKKSLSINLTKKNEKIISKSQKPDSFLRTKKLSFFTENFLLNNFSKLITKTLPLVKDPNNNKASELKKLQELSSPLKIHFFKYILKKQQIKLDSLKKEDKNQSIKTLKLTNNLFLHIKSSKNFFGFLSFLQVKSLRLENVKSETLLNKFSNCISSTQISRITDQPLNITVKPGWIYKTKNIFNLSKKIKFWIESGKTGLDDLCFEQHRILVEIIPMNLTKRTNLETINVQKKKFFKNFSQSSNIINNNGRFFNVSKNIEPKINLFFLIRPLNHKIIPNLEFMKTILYKNMKKIQNLESDSSYCLLKKYFSTELNTQKNNLKTISNFKPLDINLTWMHFFNSLPISNSKKITKSSRFVKMSVKQKKSEKVKKIPKVEQKKMFFSPQFLFKVNQKKKFFQKKTKSMIYSQNSRRFSPFNLLGRNNIYFSNYPTNFLQLKVSLSVSNSSLLSFSSPQISLNTNQTYKALCKTPSNKLDNYLKNQYLRILSLRNFKTKNSISKHFLNSPIYSDNYLTSTFKFSSFSLVTKTNYRLKTAKIISLQAFLNFAESMPFFEYSLDQKYAFLANQSLFASSFYREQFEKYLKITGLNDQNFTNETLNSKRYIKKKVNTNLVAESSRNIPFSQNHLIFRNRFYKNTMPLGLTSFYSPFEGEILKIYSQESDLKNLQKGVNVYLEKGLLNERKIQKLTLTKSDLFGLELPKLNQTKTITIDKKNFFPMSVSTHLIKSLTKSFTSLEAKLFFENSATLNSLNSLIKYHQKFQILEKTYFDELNLNLYKISEFKTYYQNKLYKLKNITFSLVNQQKKLRLGEFVNPGEKFYSETSFLKSGLIIHLNSKKLTLRKAQFFFISPQAILHTYNGHCLTKNCAVMTLPFQTLKTGDIVQGIPKVEQYLEARTTINGRLFLNSLPVLLHAIYLRYSSELEMEKAVRQSFLKIQQILVDGVQRVYRAQGVSIADKHLEIIVRQMTSKVKIIYGGQTGFFPGELVELEFVERINRFLMIKVRYEPVVLGITRASLEVDSFLSAASFQQTTKVLTRSAMENKRDFLKGLKENLLVGNLLPAGTGYVVPISEQK